jgi:hypothetical protein
VVWQTDGCTPLYAASVKSHVEAARALVGAGAAVNQARVRDDRGGSRCSAAREWLASISQRVCMCVFVYCGWSWLMKRMEWCRIRC